jgi:hypothetical protein
MAVAQGSRFGSGPFIGVVAFYIDVPRFDGFATRQKENPPKRVFFLLQLSAVGRYYISGMV